MMGRIVVLALALTLVGIAIDGPPAESIGVPTVIQSVAADTCDGWPVLVGKVLDECPHGPTW